MYTYASRNEGVVPYGFRVRGKVLGMYLYAQQSPVSDRNRMAAVEEFSDRSSVLRLPMHPQSAGAARAFVRHQAALAGFPAEAIDEITLASGEAIVNALEHGRPVANPADGEVSISVQWDREAFVVTIRDRGPGYDPGAISTKMPENLFIERGRGISLMALLMDGVEHIRLADGMLVRLEKRLPFRAEPVD
jgi:serine/threonine-protein kinase RsbW